MNHYNMSHVMKAVASNDIHELQYICETIEMEFSFYPIPYEHSSSHHPMSMSTADSQQPNMHSKMSVESNPHVHVPSSPTHLPYSATDPITPYDPRIYTLLLYSYLALSDSSSARYLHLRFPSQVSSRIQSHPDYAALLSSVTHLHARRTGAAARVLGMLI